MLFSVRAHCTMTTTAAVISHWPGLGICFCYTERTRSLSPPALDSLLSPRHDHTVLLPMLSIPLPCPPAIAPEVSYTPVGLQASVDSRRARDHRQRPAAGTSSRSTTTKSPSPPAELCYCFELCLNGTVLYVTKGNIRWGVQFWDAFV